MKRSLSLIEVLVVLALLSTIVPFLAHKIPQWRSQYSFSQDCTVVEEMLFDAQLLSIVTSQSTQVQFTREPQGLWRVSLEPFSQTQAASQAVQKRHVLSETAMVDSEETGLVVVEFSAPFGESVGVPLSLKSFHNETKECGLKIQTVSTSDKATVITDSLLNALET